MALGKLESVWYVYACLPYDGLASYPGRRLPCAL